MSFARHLAHPLADRAAESALALASARPWSEIALADIAAHMGVTLSSFYPDLDKTALVDVIYAGFDRAAALDAPNAAQRAQEAPRDRVFEAVMRRFDAMQAFKPAILSIAAAERGVIGAMARRTQRLARSGDWIAKAAGLDATREFQGAGAIIAGLLARSEAEWLLDDEGLSRTMARLDGDLRQWMRLRNGWRDVMARFSRMRRAQGGDGPVEGPEVPAVEPSTTTS